MALEAEGSCEHYLRVVPTRCSSLGLGLNVLGIGFSIHLVMVST
jgi:hypothetical protein